MRATILVCGLLCTVATFAAESDDSMRVNRILAAGVQVPFIADRNQISWQPAGGEENYHLVTGQVVAPGTRLTTGAAVVVELVRARPELRIVMEPRTRLTIRQNTSNGATSEVSDGKASFRLLGRLDFYFEVRSLQKVFAIAKGTEFSVDLTSPCLPGDRAECVTVRLDEGRLELETRHPVAIGTAAVDASPAGLRSMSSGEDDSISVTESMVAGQTQVFSLDPARFALRFATWAAADLHFAADLEQARQQTDSSVLLRALRNRAVILRLGGLDEQAAALAAEGLALARERGNRRWELRFLIDYAFARWNYQRDRNALALFEQALAMIDLIQDSITSADIASLYGRYGGIRFDARDRTLPGPDLDVAEDYMRRSLRLREAEAAPTLDLAWSHYGLGVLLGIGRRNYEDAARHLEQAVNIRRQVLGSRDDIVTAQLLAESALGREQFAISRAAADPAAMPIEMALVRSQFEESLAMLARLFPEGDHRSIGTTSRRMADFQTRFAFWLRSIGRADEAGVEYRAAVARYRTALSVLEPLPGNQSAEIRFAFRGLGISLLGTGDAVEALSALQRSLDLAREEVCAAAVGAPSLDWIDGLFPSLAQAAERAGDPAAAASYTALIGKSQPPSCGKTGAARTPGRTAPP